MNDEPQNIEQANFEVQRKTLAFETAARPPGGWVSPPAVSQGPRAGPEPTHVCQSLFCRSQLKITTIMVVPQQKRRVASVT